MNDNLNKSLATLVLVLSVANFSALRTSDS